MDPTFCFLYLLICPDVNKQSHVPLVMVYCEKHIFPAMNSHIFKPQAKTNCSFGKLLLVECLFMAPRKATSMLPVVGIEESLNLIQNEALTELITMGQVLANVPDQKLCFLLATNQNSCHFELCMRSSNSPPLLQLQFLMVLPWD